MKNMSLTQIAEACGGRIIPEDGFSDREIAGVVIDSRLVEKDFLFIAAAGERADGHDYIPGAFEKGALAVVCERLPAAPAGPCILVRNSLAALKDIAKWYRSRLNIKVVGITGSVGKTSTKEFISSVLAQKYQVLKTEGNFNNEIGLPLTILKIRDFHELAVLEMGISNFGEMHRLSEMARPDICVITNIGQCHLENLGSRQGILKAKTEIFDFMNQDGCVCINGDDDMLVTIPEVYGRKPVSFGTGPGNDVYAINIETKGLFGSTCSIHVKGAAFQADIPLPGEHMVLNALAAACVGTLLELTNDEIAAGIEAVKPLGGRSNILRQGKWTVIDDCYNANPVSMKAAVDLLTTADTRRVAILGDMFELGGRERALHREVGAYAALKRPEVLICVGRLSLEMFEGASEVILREQGSLTEEYPGTDLIYFKTREELIAAFSHILKENDTILVKASHGMGFDNVVKALLA
jgi:UDP-N-acetylmuramoyl-tripeptide--D-alanyl-D-alanine ligase